MILTNNIGLRDISALAGLPITKLNISGTSVKSLQPLAGMPLQQLCVRSTKVRDLTPLHTLERLWSLDCSYTEVSDLAPLHGLEKLNTLYLHHCIGMRDLTPLHGVDKIYYLDIAESSIESLVPLKNIHIEHLIVGNSVSDLSSLAGATIGELGLRGVSHVDLSVLANTKIGTLNIGPPMRPLKMAKGMVVDRLIIFDDWTKLVGLEQLPEALPELHQVFFNFANWPPSDCPTFVFQFPKLQTIQWSARGVPIKLSVDEFKAKYITKVKQ